jgi:hypothetical protein
VTDETRRRGWFRLWRSFFEGPIWNHRNAAVPRVALQLLCEANFRDSKLHDGRRIRPGQVVLDRRRFALKANVSEQSFRTALSCLEKLEFSTHESTSQYTVVTITNWEFYQSDEPTDQPTDQPTTNPRLTHDQPTINPILKSKKARREESRAGHSEKVVEVRARNGGPPARPPDPAFGHALEEVARHLATAIGKPVEPSDEMVWNLTRQAAAIGAHPGLVCDWIFETAAEARARGAPPRKVSYFAALLGDELPAYLARRAGVPGELHAVSVTRCQHCGAAESVFRDVTVPCLCQSAAKRGAV